jgi:hypothetical protein
VCRKQPQLKITTETTIKRTIITAKMHRKNRTSKPKPRKNHKTSRYPGFQNYKYSLMY